ncbi:hypothetical protein B0H16DRAFT_1889259 [Mycena metata]|uniref:Uncharacterized protein n=1 Tax=Mycena metata TaxID=1033252 RepID=A0AAD7IP45_9AGAR|nr:hypothetical protein B0H16DRAFT_1889259 [Mycena metata]
MLMLGNFHLPALLLPRRHCASASGSRTPSSSVFAMPYPHAYPVRRALGNTSPHRRYSPDRTLPPPAPSSSASSSVFDHFSKHGDSYFRRWRVRGGVRTRLRARGGGGSGTWGLRTSRRASAHFVAHVIGVVGGLSVDSHAR